MEEFWENLPFDIASALLEEGKKQNASIQAIKEKAYYYNKGPHTIEGRNFMFARTSEIYGKTIEDRVNFWYEVIGDKNYKLFYNLPSSTKEIIVEGEKFMI